MYTIQFQSVLYHNDMNDIYKAMDSLSNAVRIARKNGQDVQATIYYGDSTPEPLLQPDEVDEIKNRYKDYVEFKYRFFGFNSGSAKGQSLLAQESDADYILVTNPDVIVNPRFLIEMMKPFKDKKVGIVEARQTPIEHAKEYDVKTMETDWATGACNIIRREVFAEVGYYDYETFFMYCDDVDLSWRVRLAGYKIIYQPNAPVYHAKRLGSDGQWQPTSAETYYSAEAGLLMAYKWYNDEYLEQTLEYFKISQNEDLMRAAEAFENRRIEGRLPERMDKEHKVARFIEGNYSKHRYRVG